MHRASLKFLKTLVAFFLNKESLEGELAIQILSEGIFSLPTEKRNKHATLIRKLVGKLLKKLGPVYVKRVTPKRHHALLEYIEHARRNRTNKAKTIKLVALLGRTGEEKAPGQGGAGVKSEDSDSDDDMDSGEDEASERYSQDGNESDGSSDEESETEDQAKGGDTLMTDGQDIPRVDNIPVVSNLAKEKKLEQQSKLSQIADTRDKVKTLMAADAEEYESHFVENPFIRLRERVLQKNLDGKTRLGAGVQFQEKTLHMLLKCLWACSVTLGWQECLGQL